MKRVYPFVIVAVLVVAAYYVWKTYGPSLSGQIPSFHGSGAATTTTADKQLDWRTIDQSSLGFTLMMPTEPKQVVVQATNETGSTEPVNMLIAGTDSETTYAVAWADKPPVERVNNFNSDKTLDQARDGATSKTQTTLISESRVNPQGFAGREFIARNVGGGYLETRFVMAGSRLFMLIATSPSITARHDQEIARFFNSFAVSKSNKVPETLPPAIR